MSNEKLEWDAAAINERLDKVDNYDFVPREEVHEWNITNRHYFIARSR